MSISKLTVLVLATVICSFAAAYAQTEEAQAGASGLEDGGYYLAVETSLDFETAKAQAIELLKGEGFGILMEIDMQAKMQEKLGEDIPPHVILGACHPPSAYQAMMTEGWISTLMPCNVVVKQLEDGTVMVAAMNPGIMAQATGNDALAETGAELRAKLERVLGQLAG